MSGPFEVTCADPEPHYDERARRVLALIRAIDELDEWVGGFEFLEARNSQDRPRPSRTLSNAYDRFSAPEVENG